MNTDRFANVALVVLALCALAVTGVFVRREFFLPTAAGATPGATAPVFVADWKEYAGVGERMGGVGSVTIVEFSDFQCPYCARAARTLADLRRREPGVSVIYRHFPLEAAHPHALAAALAAECAGAAGRFEAFHDILFARQDSIGLLPWTVLARRAGVADTATFGRCVSESTYVDKVRADRQAGDKLGVSGTPTILVNGWRVNGAPSAATLDSMVRSAAGRAGAGL